MAPNWFAAMAQRHRERVLAIDEAGVETRYDAVLQSANAWAERFGTGKRLALLVADATPESLVQYLALLAAGHVVMPVGAELTDAQRSDLVTRYQPDVIVMSGDAPSDSTATGTARGNLNPDLAVLLSTSGSTGSPKVARFTTAQMAANAEAIVAYLGLTGDDAALAHLPLNYSFGMSIVHSHVAVGATLLPTKASMMEPGFWKQADRATSISGVPFHFEMLERLRFERKTLPKLRMLTQAGGRLAPERVQKFADMSAAKGLQFFVMYGQTEAGPRIAYLPPELLRANTGAIGLPIPGVQLHLIDDDGREVTTADTEGELVVIGPSIMLGYAENRADLGRGDDCGARLVTGDLAMRDASGVFRITGRRSSFIKVQGNRVSLTACEQGLAQAGHNVVCVGRDDALYIVTENASGTTDAVRDAAIAMFKLPPRSMKVVAIDQIPRNASGKVLAAELLKRAEALAT